MCLETTCILFHFVFFEAVFEHKNASRGWPLRSFWWNQLYSASVKPDNLCVLVLLTDTK